MIASLIFFVKKRKINITNFLFFFCLANPEGEHLFYIFLKTKVNKSF